MNITRTPRQEVIEAGIVKSLANKLQKWMVSLGKFLDNISDWDPENPIKRGSMKPKAIELLPSGVEYSTDQKKQGAYPYRLSLNIAGDDDDYRYYDIAVKPTGGDSLSVQSEKNVKVALPDIGEDDSEEEVNKAYEDFYIRVNNTLNSKILKLLQRLDKNIDAIEDSHVINSSIKVNLRKINCSEGYKTKLTKIVSSLSVPETVEALEAVLAEPEFVDRLNPDTDNWYEIVPSEDGYDVDVCEECEINICDNIKAMLQATYNFWAGCKYLGWTCSGAYSGYVESACEMYAYQAEELINYLSKLQWTYCKDVPYPAVTNTLATSPDPLDVLSDLFTEIIDTFNMNMCNFPEPQKATINRYLNDFMQYRDYTLAKMK